MSKPWKGYVYEPSIKELEKRIKALEDHHSLSHHADIPDVLAKYKNNPEFCRKIEVEKARLRLDKTFPQVGDEYFSAGYGNIKKLTWDNEEDEKLCLKSNSAFKTKQEAEHEITRRQVQSRYRNGSFECEIGNFKCKFMNDFLYWSFWKNDFKKWSWIGKGQCRKVWSQINLGLVCHPDDQETQDFIKKAVESGAYDI